MSQRAPSSESEDDDRQSRRPRNRSAKRGGNGRSFLAGFLGCGGLLALIAVIGVGIYTFYVLAPVEAQLPDNAVPTVVNLVQPFNNFNPSLSDYTQVRATAIGENPIQLMQLWVDGVAVDAHAASLAPKESFYTTEFSWRPASPGNHTLLVIAVDVNGQSALSNLVQVNAFTAPPQLAQVPVSAGDTVQTVAQAFDMTPDQVLAINPQITTAADQPLPANTTLTVLPPSGALIPNNPKPPIPTDTSLLPPPAQPPSGSVAPAPSLPTNNPAGLFTQLVVASPPTRPTAPLLSVDLEGCSVVLYFTDQSGDEDGFQVYRANPGSTDFKKIAALDASKTTGTTFSFTDPGRYGRSLYYVSAFNGAGESQSKPVPATFSDQTCIQPDQVGLGVETPKVTTNNPLDRAFCYASLDNGGWSRMPPNPESYVYPEGGFFDFSPYLNALVSPPPTKAVTLNMRCGGFAGDALVDLGVGQQTIQPNSNNQPFQLTGQGFTLTATLNFGQAQAPAVLPPPPAEPSHDRFIAPPYDVVVFTNPDTGEQTLLWRWKPSPPCDPTAPECTDIIDITGFRLYGLNTNSHEIKVVQDGLAPAQRQFKLPPLTGDDAKNGVCYRLVAYQDIYESQQSSQTCVGGLASPAPQPLPSANIAAPTNLRMTGDVADCKNHFAVKPVDWKKNNACAPLAQADSNQRAFVWEWSNTLCQPGTPNCQTIADIDGFHVYVDHNGTQSLVETLPATTKVTLQHYRHDEPLECLVVRAYKGNLESASSNKACKTLSDVGFTSTVLPPTGQYAFGSTYAGTTCDPITSTQIDTPGTAQSIDYWSNRTSYGFAVGYMHFTIGPDPACPQVTTLWREGLVTFDLGQLGSAKLQKATLVFLRDPVQNFYDASGLFPDDFVANAAQNEKDCATSLDTAVNAYTGGLYRNGQLAKAAPGSLFTGSQQVAAGPLSTGRAYPYGPDDESTWGLDVTSPAQSAAGSPGKVLSLLFSTDTSRQPETASCLSYYRSIGLMIEVAP